MKAKRLAGIDPDIASRDLFDTLAKGKSVEYELFVQMIDIEDEDKFDFDPKNLEKGYQKV